MSLLTPTVMMFLNSNLLPELQPHHIEAADLLKRAKHLLKCKEAIGNRWTKECLRSLHERHRAQRGTGGDIPAVGDVVIIKTEDKNRGKWPLGIIKDLIFRNNLVVRGAKLRAESPTWIVQLNNFTSWNCRVTDGCLHRRRW